MRYASIRNMDISNGEGVGISLFVQGCKFHCKDCFNPETWDFNGGKEWTEEIENKFIELAKRPYITRISILGGEPLAEENLDDVLDLLKQIRILFRDSKTIWLYSGYIWDDIINYTEIPCEDDIDYGAYICMENQNNDTRKEIISLCDVFVDGQYEKDKADMSYPYAGSTNQRVIDVKKSLEKGGIILHE